MGSEQWKQITVERKKNIDTCDCVTVTYTYSYIFYDHSIYLSILQSRLASIIATIPLNTLNSIFICDELELSVAADDHLDVGVVDDVVVVNAAFCVVVGIEGVDVVELTASFVSA